MQTVVKQKKHKTQVYKAIEGALERGEQVYYICPLVEAGTPDGTADAVSTYDALRRRFGAQSVGLLHGRLTAVEKDAAMADFREGRTRLLVATTIVEVGMDVENATVMVIEDADRFGLSTLHQLRGRIGRSALESTCYLVAEAKTEEARKRLSVLEETTDGLEISEADLAIRGPGELYGLRQSGSRALFTAIMENPAALEWAREDATTLVERDPNLEAPENSRLKDALERWITNRAIPVGEEAG